MDIKEFYTDPKTAPIAYVALAIGGWYAWKWWEEKEDGEAVAELAEEGELSGWGYAGDEYGYQIPIPGFGMAGRPSRKQILRRMRRMKKRLRKAKAAGRGRRAQRIGERHTRMKALLKYYNTYGEQAGWRKYKAKYGAPNILRLFAQ